MAKLTRTLKRFMVEKGFEKRAREDGKEYNLSDNVYISDEELDSCNCTSEYEALGAKLYEELNTFPKVIHGIYWNRVPGKL